MGEMGVGNDLHVTCMQEAGFVLEGKGRKACNGVLCTEHSSDTLCS
jgi:hypothetical protein